MIKKIIYKKAKNFVERVFVNGLFKVSHFRS